MAEKKRAVFVPLSVHYSRDAAIAAAGELAELLYLRGLAYCKGTDDTGFIPEYELPVVAARLTKVQVRVDALVREDLWTVVEGGWQVRSWDAWNNDSHAQAKRDQAKARQQAKRDRARDAATQPRDVTRDERDSHVPKVIQEKVIQVPTSSARFDSGSLIKEHIDAMKSRPPDRVVGQTAKLVGELLGEGVDPVYVKAGLRLLRTKALNPASLPSLVNEAMNPPAPKGPRRDVNLTELRPDGRPAWMA